MSTKSTIRKINRSYQVTLPKAFRERFDLHTGDYLEIVEENNRVIITPVEVRRKQAVEELKEMLDKHVNPELSSLPEEEVMAIVDEEIKESRAEESQKH
jgi:AbrB family looped-hinge helix DNA binding protein